MEKKVKNKDNEVSHAGHRSRLTEVLLNAGIDSVSNVQAVEFFLTYIFPRGDVNPLAHRLLSRYGNFGNIIDADPNDLITIKGINQRSARKIKMFGEMIVYYTSSKMTRKTNLKNNKEFFDILEQLLRFQTTEILYLFAIDHSFGLIQKRCLDMKNVREVGITPFDLYNFICTTKLSYLAVAHNHPNGTARPSQNDQDAVLFIEELLRNLDCKLIDSFIVGNDGIYSEKQEAFVRSFDEALNIINFYE